MQLLESLGEQIGCDAGQLSAQVAVATGSADQLAQDQQRPPLAQDVEPTGDRAVLVVVPAGGHSRQLTELRHLFQVTYLISLSINFNVLSMRTVPVIPQSPDSRARRHLPQRLRHQRRRHHRQRRAAHPVARTRRRHRAAAMDRRRVHPGHVRPAAFGRQPQRPLRQARLAQPGLALFAITSGIAAQVNSADQLIAARAAMGVGAAVIFPTTLGLITNIFTDPVPRAKAIGLWAAMVGVGVAVGPISGGWLLEHFWWGAIFMVNIPIAVLAIIGGSLFVPTSRDPAAPRVDVPGLILSAAGITALVYTVIEAPTWGWTSTRAAAGFAVAAIVLVGFALWERRSTHPMLDVSVFSNRRFSGGSLAVTAGFLTLFGFIFVITQYFQFIKNYTAFQTGVRLLPVAVSIALASLLGPRLVERVGTTAVAAGGLAVFAAGLAWASTADAATLSEGVRQIVSPIFLPASVLRRLRVFSIHAAAWGLPSSCSRFKTSISSN